MSERIFVTGGTGYIGSYVTTRLALHHDARILLLVRAKDRAQAIEKLWKGLEMHVDAEQFRHVLSKVEIVRGDLTAPGLGIDAETRRRVVKRATSVLHIAASLNRRSEKECLNANLRGTLSVLQLAREIRDAGGLRRFSDVSTVAVAGRRGSEVVPEDRAIEWERSDYDPYARTKKFAEHMVAELLPDVSRAVFRPSIVMGDSRHARTTQFDMVRAFVTLADLPVLPMKGTERQDIVNADWVSKGIADLHLKPKLTHEIYHLAAGASAKSAEQIFEGMLAKYPDRRRPLWAPRASGTFQRTVDQLAMLPKGRVSRMGAILKVFWPYVVSDTVYDGTRAAAELGESPVPFTKYCGDLYAWAKEHHFEYPHRPMPSSLAKVVDDPGAAAWA